MILRRKPVLLALLALAAPLPALATSEQAPEAALGPAALAVSASLDSCGVIESQLVCKLDVSYNDLANATSYSASVTRADGSVVDYGSVGAGGTSLWVPYVGAGSYSVSVTAYGDPEEPGDPREKIATEVSDADAETADAKLETGDGAKLDAEAEGRDGSPAAEAELGGGNGEAEAEATASCSDAPVATAIPPKPPEPPKDLDPANPAEDADTIPDAQEVAEYERLVAERERAIAAAEGAQLPESVNCK